MERLNGSGRRSVPRNWGELKETMDSVANAAVLRDSYGTPEGNELRALLSAITQKLWKNPRDEERLDEGTREQIVELLDRLNMLGYCTREYMLKLVRKRTRKSIAELLPQPKNEQETGALPELAEA
jgi:hypothetical protein